MLTSDAQPPSLAPENRHPSNVQLPHSQAEKTLIPLPCHPGGSPVSWIPSVSPSAVLPLTSSLHTCPVKPAVALETRSWVLMVSLTRTHSPLPATLPRVPVSQPSPHTPPGLEPPLLPSPPHLSGPKRLRQPPGDEGAAIWSHLSPGRLEGQGFPSLASKAAALPKH